MSDRASCWLRSRSDSSGRAPIFRSRVRIDWRLRMGLACGTTRCGARGCDECAARRASWSALPPPQPHARRAPRCARREPASVCSPPRPAGSARRASGAPARARQWTGAPRAPYAHCRTSRAPPRTGARAALRPSPPLRQARRRSARSVPRECGAQGTMRWGLALRSALSRTRSREEPAATGLSQK